jgi:5-formyltetrahydrofolate cyclo-ligase
MSTSAVIQERLLHCPAVQDAQHWFVYVSAGSEVATHDLIRELLGRSQTVAVPRVLNSSQIIAQPIRSFEELAPGTFGLLEPKPSEERMTAIDVAVCPGIAFTNRSERLGSGGGYYDRFLAANPPRIAIGLAFECQITSREFPIHTYDRPMDFVITEKRVLQRPHL